MNDSNDLRPFGTQKPGKVQALAIMTLINGALNIVYALGATLAIVLGTLGIGLLCAPVTILPAVLGVFEILWAIKLLSDPPQPVQPSQVIPILEISCILTGNVVSLVVGILSLVFQNELEVKRYFAEINAAAPGADLR